MLALILQSVQAGNWQRGGGKGRQPQRINRPADRPTKVSSVRSAEDLVVRRAAQQAELARRRARRQRKGA